MRGYDVENVEDSYAESEDDGDKLVERLLHHRDIYEDDRALTCDIDCVRTPTTAPGWERWYILFVFSLFNFSQSLAWLTFSLTPMEIKKYFPHANIDDRTVDLLLNWGSIIYLPAGLVLGWVMVTPGGFRKTIVIGVVLTFIGGVLKMIPFIDAFHLRNDKWNVLYLFHLGQIINAAGGPATSATPTELSARWFPESERTMATAIASVSGNLGCQFGYLFGPWVVETEEGVAKFFALQLTIEMLSLLLVLVWFPNDASHHQCIHQSRKRPQPKQLEHSFWQSCSQAVNNPDFMLLALACGFQLYVRAESLNNQRAILRNERPGVTGAWGGILQNILNPLGYSTKEVGFLQFISSGAGILGAFMVSRLADKYLKHWYKTLILMSGMMAFISFVWFTLSFPTPYSLHPIYHASWFSVSFSIVAIGLFLGSVAPLYYELSAELTYPLPEGISAGIISMISNAFTVVTLLISPEIDKSWMNLLTTATLLITWLMTIRVRAVYRRTQLQAAALKTLVQP